MASTSASLEVDEDHTDEDFFDRLINDDRDDDVATTDHTGSLPTHVDRVDSDELKAFSNLSIDDGVEIAPDLALESNTGIGRQNGSVLASNSENLGLFDRHENVNEVTDRDVGKSSVVVSENIESEILTVYNGHVSVSESSGVTDRDVGKSSVVVSENVESEKLGLFNEHESANESSEDFDRDLGNCSAVSGNSVKLVQWSSFGGSETGSRLNSGGFGEIGDVLVDPFANVGHVDSGVKENLDAGGGFGDLGRERKQYGAVFEQSVGSQDLSDSQYLENMYPGWRFDTMTGRWLRDELAEANTASNGYATETFDASADLNSSLSVPSFQVSDVYLHNVSHSITGSSASEYVDSSLRNESQGLQENAEYPAHMVFDPQYPDWYYDTIAQEWKSLESYTSAANQSTKVDYNYTYETMTAEDYGSQGINSQLLSNNLNGKYSQDNTDMWVMSDVTDAVLTERQQLGKNHSPINGANNFVDQWAGPVASKSVDSFEMASQGFDHNNGVPGFPRFDSATEIYHHHSQSTMESSQQINFSTTYSDKQQLSNLNGQHFDNVFQFSPSPSTGRSSVGRPPHALITFGFGGKLLVMKNSSSFMKNSVLGTEDVDNGVVSVLSLVEVVLENGDGLTIGSGANDYFQTLCRHSFPGPLVGGSVGAKEVNKWIDDQIARCGSPYGDYKNVDVVRLLFSLLKISCQHYGKLRSPFGLNQGLEENNSPESAVANLFASARNNSTWPSSYWPNSHCLQSFPSEAQIQATALEMQRLLVSGRKKEALECAQQGHLWGPALVLATQLGDQFFSDTVMKMAYKQLVAGSPLRTLCLLISGNPAQVFSNAATSGNFPGSVNPYHQFAQTGTNTMLDEWQENLAIITANRTNGDELVLVHLGDCLWKEMGEVIAAHLCYLVAEANFESYSDGARLCLIGADHLKFPRTYASPEAIQRTELLEYSKVLGNSQFLLLPFQPYKLAYAYMLAEVGKVSDALKFCQALLRSLKTGQTPQVEMWRQLALSFEERLRVHQQGGYSITDPSKLVGKLLTLIDNTAHRVVGGLPPPVSSTSSSSIQHNEYTPKQGVASGYGSQSTIFMPSSVPSASNNNVGHNEYTPKQGVAGEYGSQSSMFIPSSMPSASNSSIRHDEYAPKQTMFMPSSIPSASNGSIRHNEYAPKQGVASGYGSQSTMFVPSSLPSASNNSVLHNEFAPKQGVASGYGSQSTMFMPPSVPSASNNSILHNEFALKQGVASGYGSQSTMFMPPLIPSASMEPISALAGENKQPEVPNRSISEPDFGTEPKKVQPSKDLGSNDQDKPSASNSSSRFGRFSTQIFQKTVGLVFRSRPSRQAKLGEKNKFYYDEKLKRWVEEGAEPPAEEPALPPPPTMASFQPDLPKPSEEVKGPMPPEQSPGIPNVPPSTNQFSARGRIAVRARYVDTFNKDGGTRANLFHSPLPASSKPGGVVNTNFFVPSAMTSEEDTDSKVRESTEEAAVTTESSPASSVKEYFSSAPITSTPPSSLPPTMQRFPSVDNIVQKRRAGYESNDSDHPSRRVASWNGSLSESPYPTNEENALQEPIGFSPLSRTATDSEP